jgi:hypothetical protein
MLIRCAHCFTPFTLTPETIQSALDQIEDNGWKHYNAYCPRCGKPNVVGRDQLMRFAPEWAANNAPGPTVTPEAPAPKPVTAPPPSRAAPASAPKPAAKPKVAAKPKAAPAKKTARPKKAAPAKKKAAAKKKPAAKKAAKPKAKSTGKKKKK